MRLTDHTDYSLRVLMYLNQTKKLTTLNELAKKLGVSKNNLIKVSNQLVKLQLVEATRGRAGGLRIHPTAGEVTLRDIVRNTEENFFLADCFSGKKDVQCSFLKGCLLKRSLNQALEAFLDSLEQITLDDVTLKTKT